MKSLSLVVVLLSISSYSFGQRMHPSRDTVTKITTSSGTSVLGSIEKETEDSIYFQTTDGVKMQLPRSSVTEINYRSLTPRKHWSEFGGVLGTPAGLNFVVGTHWPSIGIRLSGAYWGGSLYGVQVGLPINLYRSENTSHDIAPFFSTTHLISNQMYYTEYGPMELPTGRSWTCAGAAYIFNTYGFSFEFGLDVGSGAFSNPQVDFQIGYVHQNK